MSLFSAFEAAPQPEPAAIAELQRRIKDMEDRARIVEKYGPCKDDQIAEYLDQEEREKRRVVEGEARVITWKKEQEKSTKETIAACQKAIKTGRLRVRINGVMINDLPDIQKNCPACGGYLPGISEVLYKAGEMARSPPAKITDVMSGGILSGGYPGIWYAGSGCVCGSSVQIEAQFILIE